MQRAPRSPRPLPAPIPERAAVLISEMDTPALKSWLATINAMEGGAAGSIGRLRAAIVRELVNRSEFN
jgi:hypothetical protein